ncbi:MAG: alpha/beta hydrolase [Solirubrobacteraceae bacterium]
MSSQTCGRRDVAFTSAGEQCRAWLYLPDAERPPLVILGHGVGATREYGLEPYAQRFADAGIAALVFTYRHFGDSGGQPRQLLDIGRQLEDWAAALAYARTLGEIDSRRIALWGTSFGGGHVLVAAARDGLVAAVVSQCPFTDGLAATRAAHPRSLIQATGLALRDQLGSLRGQPPVMVPLVGGPGSTALMTSPDSEPGYRALIPPNAEFHNGVAARFLLHVGRHRPGRSAKKIKAPVLFCICDTDAVAPADTALHYARTAPRGEVRRYPVGHFDIYLGEPFENAVRDQTEFLVRHLGVEQLTTAEIEGKHGES